MQADRQTGGQAREQIDAGNTESVPTPQEWAEQQLKNAPHRSPEWAKAVATIYGLDTRE